MDDLLTYTDYFFLAVFTIEMCIRILGFGFFLNQPSVVGIRNPGHTPCLCLTVFPSILPCTFLCTFVPVCLFLSVFSVCLIQDLKI